ncbi:MAG: MMPL family transporter [Thermoleophilaceae bacterium]|nr:MMPL family transporter [Thermoleophilaceae bacterium]
MRSGGKPLAGGTGRIAWAVIRARWLVLLVWVALATWLTVALPTVDEAQVGALGDLVPREADAVDAELRSSELFRFPPLSRTIVVQRSPDGLSLAEQARVARRALALNLDEYPGLRQIGGAIPVTNALGQPPLSREGSTTALTYLLFPPRVGREERQRLAERFVERRIEPDFDGFVGVTGAVAARDQQSEVIRDSLPLVEAATVVLVALVVGLHFRAIGAPLVTLLAVGVSFLTSIRLIAWVGERAGISVPSEVEPVIVVLLFGVVTDYSIFFLSRVRRRLAQGEHPHEAAMRATAELLPIIATAAITVAAASASLVLGKLGFFQAFGPGVAMAVLIGLAVAVTLVPALLAIGGISVFWPRHPGVEIAPREATEEPPTELQGRPWRAGAVHLATIRPATAVALSTALLLVAASGLSRLDLGNPLVRGLPPSADAREAYSEASRGFTSGILSPTVILVERSGITGERRSLARLQELLERQPGVAEVVGPADQPARREFGAVLSSTADAARFFVVFGSDPLGAAAIADMRQLRAALPSLLREAGVADARAQIAGDTALVSETIERTVADIARIAPAGMAVVVLILVVFLRALVAPLYLAAVSILALAASLGLTVYLLQQLASYGDVTYFVPFAAAVLLVSLGSDYNIFLVGRVWDEARRHPLKEAVAIAAARAATPITVAGIVLAGSFALLALVPLRPFRELALIMSVGLLLDVFLVRTVLVPALIVIVGKRSGWPGKRLERREPAVVGDVGPGS